MCGDQVASAEIMWAKTTHRSWLLRQARLLVTLSPILIKTKPGIGYPQNSACCAHLATYPPE